MIFICSRILLIKTKLLNKMKFNIERYKELLIKAESSKKTGKAYFEDPEVLELLNYESKVESQIFWEDKNEYLKLIQKYLDEKISSGNFRCEYLDMIEKSMEKTTKILNNLDELSNFWIDPEGKNLGSLLSEIHGSCQCIIEFGIENSGFSEDGFRNLLNKVVLEMKKYDS